MVLFLSKMNRIAESIQLLENLVKNATMEGGIYTKMSEKIVFSIEIAKNLTETVEKSGDKNLQIRLAKVFRQMDSVAVISDKNVTEMIAQTIDVTKKMKYKREKNRIARQREAETVTNALNDIQQEENEHDYYASKNEIH